MIEWLPCCSHCDCDDRPEPCFTAEVFGGHLKSCFDCLCELAETHSEFDPRFPDVNLFLQRVMDSDL